MNILRYNIEVIYNNQVIPTIIYISEKINISEINNYVINNDFFNSKEYINSLDSNSSYIMIASAYLNYLSGQGDAVTLKSINLYLEFYLSTVKVSSSRITIGTITKYASTSSGSEKAYYPFSVYISGITKIIYNFSTTTNSGIGSWDTGIHNCTFIRLT